MRRATDGRVFVEHAGQQVRLYSWVDLRAPDARLDPGQVGRLLAGLHRVPTPDPIAPVDDWYQAPVGAAAWDRVVAELTTAGAPFAHPLASLRDELVALESRLEPPRVTRVCHRDLWTDNLRATADGGLCVIDWENSGPADPVQELGCVVFEFGRSDPARARAVHDAYRAAGGPRRVPGGGRSGGDGASW